MDPRDPGLRTLELSNSETPSASIILLHGLGDTAEGISHVAEALELGETTVRFVVPTAPIRPVTLNQGWPMTAWYDILSLAMDARIVEDEQGLRQSLAVVHRLIDREVERGVPAGRVVVMGFSQGCAMTLLSALRYPQRLAAIVGLSGYLPLASTTAAERADANNETPIFLGHGRLDDVVPVIRGEQSRDALVELGYDVSWHTYDMGHSICAEEAADVSAFLRERLTVTP